MKRFGIAVSVISAVYFSALGVSAGAEFSTAQSEKSYCFNAERFTYSGDMAEFTVDLPVIGDYMPGDGSSREVGDGSVEWQLFNAEWELGSISCAFHRSETGFEGAAASWGSDIVLHSCTDSDGTVISVAELRIGSYCSYLAEIPWGDETWINITVSVDEEKMDDYRDDMLNMFGTFSRHAAESDMTPETVVSAYAVDIADNEDTPKDSPNTGAEFPAAVAALAAAAGGALFVSRKKS